MRETGPACAGEDACVVTYLTLCPPLCCFHGPVTQMAPQSNYSNYCKLQQLSNSFKNVAIHALKSESNKQAMITGGSCWNICG